MDSVIQQTDTIQIADLQPGITLIDTHQKSERTIRQVEPHDTVVRLFFEDDDIPITYSVQELQSRFQLASDAFRADANLVRLVAEAHRLQHAYLFNPIFATETSLIDPLPHQFIAVYEHLLKHYPLRFLLADDAGAGKTIMTGLYIQELLLRQQVKRILIVPPAGLIGNWERELRVCFRLQFRIMSSADAVNTNPFANPENRLAIMSLDTLRQDRTQDCLLEAQPYDLVVFDEAHKLSARFEGDGTVYKSKRYELAERIAAQEKNLLLLTATPHMGKDDAYYFLWRLLLPECLAAQKAFERLPDKEKSKHLLRRMKEEMVNFDGKPIYPPRRSQTIAYPLKQGEMSEQSLYDAVTAYCEQYFDLAGQYNRSAAKMAMMILQRRLASSTDKPHVLDEMLVGIKRFADGRCEETPAHLLLTLIPRTEQHSMPATLSTEWINRDDETQPIENFVCENFGNPKLAHIRDMLQSEMDEKKEQIKVSSRLREGELLKQRLSLKKDVAKGIPAAQTKLNNCDQEIKALPKKRAEAEANLIREIEDIHLGPVVVYVRAFVTTSLTGEISTKTLRDTEAIAIKTAIEYERKRGAEVKDVSNPSLKKGFDLQSRHPNGEVRYIEVKGRTGITSVELTANEWLQAANHSDHYWLYVVYHCDTKDPQLYPCPNPSGNLTAKATGSIRINAGDIMKNSDVEAFNTNVNPTIRG